MGKTVYETVSNVYNRLENDSRITIDSFTIGDPASSKIVNNESIPDILKQFYRTANGYSLAWHVTDKPSIRGGIAIPAIENIHTTRWSGFGALDYTDDIHAIFRLKDGEDSRVIAESLGGDENVELMDLASGIVTIGNYFYAFEKTAGFRFWQEKYSDSEDYTLDSIIENDGYMWTKVEEVSVF